MAGHGTLNTNMLVQIQLPLPIYKNQKREISIIAYFPFLIFINKYYKIFIGKEKEIWIKNRHLLKL